MISALIFDKDGTLFDFTASWGAWVERMVTQLATDAAQQERMFSALGYSITLQQFKKNSPVIAGTAPEIAAILAKFVPHLSLPALLEVMNTEAGAAPLVPAVDLPQVLGDLRNRGLRLGLATNDSEAPARAHLARAGVTPLFDFIAGCDSGFGGKPAAGQLLAFARQIGAAPAQIAMVGDSLHDLHAARTSGMHAIAVLTGIATAEVLAPHADVVLPDIGHIAAWLDRA